MRTADLTKLDRLVTKYQAWCKAEGLRHIPATEQKNLSTEQRIWITEFIEDWNTTMNPDYLTKAQYDAEFLRIITEYKPSATELIIAFQNDILPDGTRIKYMGLDANWCTRSALKYLEASIDGNRMDYGHVGSH